MSLKKKLREEARRLASYEVVDIAARVQVYRRGPDDKPYPAEFLGDAHGTYVWGGRYSSEAKGYIGPPGSVVTLTCHPGQVRLLTYQDSTGTKKRVLCLGAAGGGKTKGIAIKGLLEGIKTANRIVGMVAPTGERRLILWKKFLEIVEPLGWVEKIWPVEKDIRLKNGTIFQFRAAKKASDATGVPVQGYDWDVAVEDEQQNITDEALTEVDLRGRRAGTAYRVYSSATNQLIIEFQNRLQTYKRAEWAEVINFSGYDNSWVETAYWDSFKARMSAKQFNRLIKGESPPIDGLIYPSFDEDRNVKPRPFTRTVITRAITLDKYGSQYSYIVGQDFGQRVNTSTVFKVWAGDGPDDRLWFAVGEIQTVDKQGITAHIPRLVEYMRETFGARAHEFIVIGDPHFGKTHTANPNENADISDYEMMRNAGIRTEPAHWQQITLKHRFGMVNTMLQDATGVIRLYVEADEHGQPKCPLMVSSFKFYKWNETTGKPEQFNKDARDPSHATDTLYCLFPWEHFRGNEAALQSLSPSALKKAN